MLERFSNFHTHTVLCDGKDEPEELVQRALELAQQSAALGPTCTQRTRNEQVGGHKA